MSTEITRLPSGLRIATLSMPALETASVGVFADVGTRHEAEKCAGIAHMLEHMVFKGTKRRSARRIAEEIEAVGGHLNAYTTRDMTSFYARVLKDDVPLALDMLADLLTQAVFDPREVVREREVIVQEIGQAQDTPDDIIFDHLQSVAFPDQPLGWSILGLPASVRETTDEDLRRFRAAQYRTDNLVIAAAGKVRHEDIVKLAAEAFAGLPQGAAPHMRPARYRGGERHDRRSLEQLHLALGLPGLAYTDPDIYALQVYATILGGGMSSRLFQEVREERGLAYSVFADVTAHADTGLITIYAGTGPEDGREALDLIITETKRMADKIPEEELARARAQLKAGLFMALESAAAQCEQLGRHILMFDRPISSNELVAHIDAVDSAAVERVAETLLEGPLSFATVGPETDLGSYQDIAAQLKR